MRRGTAATALVAALALVAAACGDDGGGSGGGEEGSGGLSGTVTWWDTSNEAEKETFERIAKDFEKKHPDVTVDYVSVPFTDAQNKIKNAFSSGSGAPDVIRTEVAWTPEFASLGYLAPLDDVEGLGDQSAFLEQARASTRFEGKTYAVPQVIDSLGLFYNKRLLHEAGVEPPQDLQQLKAASKKIKDETGATGFYLRGDDAYWFLPFLYGEGGDMVDAEAKEVTIDDESGVRAFAAARDLLDSGAAQTDATDGYNNMQTAFKSGKVAMMVNGPWAVADTYTGEEFKDESNLGVTTVPGGSAGRGSPQGGWNLAAYAGSDNLESSYAFMEYMASEEVQIETAEELSLLPTRTAAYEDPDVKANQMIQFFKPAVENSVERPWIPEGGSLFQPLVIEYTNVLTGKSSPEEAARKVGDEYRELLKDWQ